MSEAKTYYGPWLETIPTDTPDGSIWDALCFYSDEKESAVFNRIVGRSGRIPIGEGYFDEIAAGYGAFKIRRVYPPGSVLPEPRPLVIDGNVRDLSGSEWWMCDRRVLPAYRVTFHPTEEILDPVICYPVDPLPNGAFVPRPWPDSGCTTE